MSESLPRLGALITVAVLVALGLAAFGSESSPRTHTVEIDATSYSPRILEVSVGDTVVWTNRDVVVHTVTARDGTFDSKDLASGESWRYEISTPEKIDYYCVYHPVMRGTLRPQSTD